MNRNSSQWNSLHFNWFLQSFRHYRKFPGPLDARPPFKCLSSIPLLKPCQHAHTFIIWSQLWQMVYIVKVLMIFLSVSALRRWQMTVSLLWTTGEVICWPVNVSEVETMEMDNFAALVIDHQKRCETAVFTRPDSVKLLPRFSRHYISERFRSKRWLCMKMNRQTAITHLSIPTVMFLLTTRGCVSVCVRDCACVWSALRTVHILPSKSWPVFSSRADMQGPPRVHTKWRAPLHLAPAISESSADSLQDQASTYLSCDDLLRPCRVPTYSLYLLYGLFRFSLFSSDLSGFSPQRSVLPSTCSDGCTIQHYMHWAVVTY